MTEYKFSPEGVRESLRPHTDAISENRRQLEKLLFQLEAAMDHHNELINDDLNSEDQDIADAADGIYDTLVDVASEVGNEIGYSWGSSRSGSFAFWQAGAC